MLRYRRGIEYYLLSVAACLGVGAESIKPFPTLAISANLRAVSGRTLSWSTREPNFQQENGAYPERRPLRSWRPPHTGPSLSGSEGKATCVDIPERSWFRLRT
jgi:hypothetical protein